MKATKVFITEGQEIAITLLTDLGLITKRLENRVQRTNNYTPSAITSVQPQLNRKMKSIKEKIDELRVS